VQNNATIKTKAKTKRRGEGERSELEQNDRKIE
jgi:hypothetical protein